MATTNGSQSVSKFPTTSICQSSDFPAACRKHFFNCCEVFSKSLESGIVIFLEITIRQIHVSVNGTQVNYIISVDGYSKLYLSSFRLKTDWNHHFGVRHPSGAIK